MKYHVIIEPTRTGYSAYSEDLLGCVAAAATLDEIKTLMSEAMVFHIEGLRMDPRCEAPDMPTEIEFTLEEPSAGAGGGASGSEP